MELTPWREAVQRGARTLVILLIGIGAYSIADGNPTPAPQAQHMTVTP